MAVAFFLRAASWRLPRPRTANELAHDGSQLVPGLLQVIEAIAGGAGAYDASTAIAFGVVAGMTGAFSLYPLFDRELVIEFQQCRMPTSGLLDSFLTPEADAFFR